MFQPGFERGTEGGRNEDTCGVTNLIKLKYSYTIVHATISCALIMSFLRYSHPTSDHFIFAFPFEFLAVYKTLLSSSTHILVAGVQPGSVLHPG